MAEKELKQKIRKLKKLELMFRYGFSKEYIEKHCSVQQMEKLPLVWRDFFDLSNSDNSKARYTIHRLEKMDKEQIKQVFGEYWFMVFYQMYQANGIQRMDVQNPELLAYLGLPFDADQAAIKKRFRELSKACHPDEGGDAEKFIELMKIKDKYEVR